MKRFLRMAASAAFVLLLSACARHKIIPDDTLAQIFHDAFLTNAYIGSEGVKTDSLRIYEPIFARYGYTTDDVHYTIGNFSKRKSARLGDVVERAIEMLKRVGMQNPEQRMNAYPHQLSGGMCQRAMIAMALMLNPRILIADEPTTALDVTVQAQITDLMLELQETMGMSMIYITHDMGVISEVADDICVMYLGRVMEQGTAEQIFLNPTHPYTVRLLRSIPKLGRKVPGARLDAINGNVPVPIDPKEECGFCSRCLEMQPGKCDAGVPELIEVEPGHFVRCCLRGKGGV